MSNPDPFNKHSNIPDSYPNVVGLSGAYAGAAPDIARKPNDLMKLPAVTCSTIVFTVSELIVPVSPPIDNVNQGTWTGVEALDQDIWYKMATFNVTVNGRPVGEANKVPAPLIRVTEGNVYTISLVNPVSSTSTHSIDFHGFLSNTGQMLSAAPGSTAKGTFVFTKPGRYVYHGSGNGSAGNIAEYIARGMHGIIIVEPAVPDDFVAFSRSATEFYVVENEFSISAAGLFNPLNPADQLSNYYVFDDRCYFPDASYQYLYQAGLINYFTFILGASGTQQVTINTQLVDNTVPPKTFSFFNGRAGALVDFPLSANINQDVVIYFAKFGTYNSAPHMIGGIWDEEITGKNSVRYNIDTGNVSPASVATYVMYKSSLRPSVGQGNTLINNGSGFLRHGALGFMTVAVPPDAPNLITTFTCNTMGTCCEPKRHCNTVNIVKCIKTPCPPCPVPPVNPCTGCPPQANPLPPSLPLPCPNTWYTDQSIPAQSKENQSKNLQSRESRSKESQSRGFQSRETRSKNLQ